MARILGIGIATLDIVNTVADYPREDDEVRALEQRVVRGGNVTNMLVVLSQLGHRCCWGGVLTNEPGTRVIRDDLAAFDIDTRYAREELAGSMPTSYITLNRRNGSRTIVHYRDLVEFGCRDFEKIDLSAFDWLHFEGRNVPETRKMLDHVQRLAKPPRVSVEIEKRRDGLEALFNGPGLLFFSQAYVATSGSGPAEFLAGMREQLPETELVCTWGDQGAYALDGNAGAIHRPAWAPARIVDTLGAGDTFIAGYIDARARGRSTAVALEQGCRIAGEKCGRAGFRLGTPTP